MNSSEWIIPTPPVPPPRFRKAAVLAGLAVWLGFFCVGLGLMVKFDTAAGAQGPTLDRWPVGSSIEAARPGIATLVLFVHPRCPCTRASLSELNHIMNEVRGRAEARVVFLKPGESGPGWERTSAWKSAGTIPGAIRIVDWLGQESRRFGAETSGHLILFDPHGVVRYTGGITASRGREGNNGGRQTVLSLLRGERGGSWVDETGWPRVPHPVFGCPLEEKATL